MKSTDDRQPPKHARTMTVPLRFREMAERETPLNDFDLASNSSITDMLTERLQELVATKAVKQEELLGPSERSRTLLDGEEGNAPIVNSSPGAPTNDFRPFITKVLSRAGCCSRSEASNLLSRRLVAVNGQLVTDAFFVCKPTDNITVQGVQGRLRFMPPRLWIYHKPRNVSASLYDAQGRKVMLAHAAALGFEHLLPVCRLGFGHHGLMLLTNDGGLASYLEHPTTQMQHVYRYRVSPPISPTLAQDLNERGVDIDGVKHGNYEFAVDPRRSQNFVKVRVRGEKIPVTDMLKAIGRSIKRGGRSSVGPFTLEGLGLGQTREVSIPPAYFEHIGNHWKPFIERDWPFFRRKRIQALKSISKYRILNQKEVEELDTYSSEESREVYAHNTDGSVHHQTLSTTRPTIKLDPSSPYLQ